MNDLARCSLGVSDSGCDCPDTGVGDADDTATDSDTWFATGSVIPRNVQGSNEIE